MEVVVCLSSVIDRFFDFMFDSSLGLKNGLVLHESLLKLCRVAGGVLRKKFNDRTASGKEQERGSKSPGLHTDERTDGSYS